MKRILFSTWTWIIICIIIDCFMDAKYYPHPLDTVHLIAGWALLIVAGLGGLFLAYLGWELNGRNWKRWWRGY